MKAGEEKTIDMSFVYLIDATKAPKDPTGNSIAFIEGSRVEIRWSNIFGSVGSTAYTISSRIPVEQLHIPQFVSQADSSPKNLLDHP